MALPEPKASLRRLFNRVSASYARYVFSRMRRETAERDATGLHLKQRRGEWLFCAQAARLLWRK